MIHPMDESWAIAHLKRERDDYKTQRDTLIDDIAVLRANNERLERENEKLRKANYDGWKEKDKVINNLHYLYTTLTNHIRDMRSDMLKTYENYEVQKHINKDEGIHKILEGAQISLAIVLDELNKIDELERADDER